MNSHLFPRANDLRSTRQKESGGCECSTRGKGCQVDPRPGASFFVVGISLEVTLDKGRFVCAAAFKAGAGRKPPQALDIRSAYSWPRTLRIRLRRVPHGACLTIIKSADDGIETSASRESARGTGRLSFGFRQGSCRRPGLVLGTCFFGPPPSANRGSPFGAGVKA